MKIDGKKIAEGVYEHIETLRHAQQAASADGFLAAVLVGGNPASEHFVKIKKQTAERLGIDFRVYRFEADISTSQLRAEVVRIGGHGTCWGLIVQLPLPQHINRQRVLNAIPAMKDVDVLSEEQWGRFVLGRSKILPPAVGTVQQILSHFNFEFSACRVAVVGAGFLVGRPLATWLAGRAAEVAVFDTGSDLSRLSEYDLVISGVGKAGIIKPIYLHEGAGVIDFGYDVTAKGNIGDLSVEDEQALEKLSFWTPAPGGTGPVLVAKIFENFFVLAVQQE